MIGGIILVVVFVLAIAVAFIIIVRALIGTAEEWWSKPPEVALQLPPPSVTGPECIVLAFADMFIEAAESPSEHLKTQFTQVPSSGMHVHNRQLAEEMLFASFVWLFREGAIEWSLRKRNIDPFSPFPPRDWELHMRPIRAFPRTPFGRNFEVGFKRALKSWLIHKPGDDTASVEEVIEFSLREMRKLMGRMRLSGDACKDLIQYVQRFLAEQGLYEMHEEVGFLGRRMLSFKPIKERFEELRPQAEQLKAQLMEFMRDEPTLAEQLRTSISEGMAAIRQLEPNRDLFF